MTRQDLEDEREFALRSLRDLEREHDAGDLAEDDYRRLRDRYTARAAAVLRALEWAEAPTVGAGLPDPTRAGGPSGPGAGTATGPEPPPPAEAMAGDAAPAEAMAGDAALPAVTGDAGAGRGAPSTSGAAGAPGDPDAGPPAIRAGRRRVLLVGGLLALFAAVAVAVVANVTSNRLPGDTATGSATLSADQQVTQLLDQAEILDAEGQRAEALQLYGQVLARRPGQPEALAESGWIDFATGVQSHRQALVEAGQRDEEEAVRVAPGSWAARLYLGSMDYTEGDWAAAVAQYTRLVSDDPPAASLQAAMPYIVRAFDEAGRKLPALPAGVHATAAAPVGTAAAPGTGTGSRVSGGGTSPTGGRG